MKKASRVGFLLPFEDGFINFPIRGNWSWHGQGYGCGKVGRKLSKFSEAQAKRPGSALNQKGGCGTCDPGPCGGSVASPTQALTSPLAATNHQLLAENARLELQAASKPLPAKAAA